MDLLEMTLIEPIERFIDEVVSFLPNFLTAILILITGLILSLILKSLSLKLFKAIGLDKFLERIGAAEAVKKGGMQESVSALLSKLIGGLTVVIFAGISLSALEIPAMEGLLYKFPQYLPNIVVAILILLLGYLAGNFLGRTVLIASVNAGIKFSGLIGKAVRLTVFVLAATMALEQLGIGKETVLIAFAIIFGGIVLALAIAFGVGGRDIAKDYLEKRLKGEEKKDDIEHL